jgi:DNA-binding transcriptional MerR regulator
MIVNEIHARSSRVAAVEPGTDRLTIDELARASGTKVSTIRLYQQRGLLPPPAIEGRVGFYDAGHIARLRLVADLQTRGFSLAAIRELADTWEAGRDLGALLGIERVLGSTATRRRMARSELEQRFPELAGDAALMARFETLGAARVLGTDEVEVDPGVLDLGVTISAVGVPLSVMLDEFERVDEFARETADRYVGLFERYVWEPLVANGMGGADLEQAANAISALRESAIAVVAGALRQAIDAAAADAVARHARDLAP